MGGGSLNSKKKWHPSRFETQAKVVAAEKALAQEKRDEAADLQLPVRASAHEKRMEWMIPGFGADDCDLESRFEQ